MDWVFQISPMGSISKFCMHGLIMWLFLTKNSEIYFGKSSSISLAHFHPRSLIANLYEFEWLRWAATQPPNLVTNRCSKNQQIQPDKSEVVAENTFFFFGGRQMKGRCRTAGVQANPSAVEALDHTSGGWKLRFFAFICTSAFKKLPFLHLNEF